jgi:hypothetical protein
MTLIDFPTPKEAYAKPKTLEDWPWDPELGKPHIDINHPVITYSNPPEEEVNDLARYIEKSPINPPHYKAHPSGIECIQITEHMNFCLGNAVKYIWRAGLKEGNDRDQDLEKAMWYLQRELRR